MDMHPRIAQRKISGPPKLADHSGDGLNDRLADLITKVVGTMWAFYVFTALALVSLPSVVKSGDPVIIVSWVAQTFLQLVLLAVLQTSANRSGKAGDARAESTFKDTEAIIHTLLEVEKHLIAQDIILQDLIRKA
jgi:low affinity Fe/Cu permease